MQPTKAGILLKDIAQSVPETLTLAGVVTDSRAAAPGCVFVAIKGERVDGHDYAAEALAKGAALVVAGRPIAGIPTEKTVLVEDVLDAMIAMAANYRAQFSPMVLGVTGSVGKTSTKEFCAAVFSAFGQTLKTEGNQNNEIGMPNTLFRLDEHTRYAVVEMGMQHLGEIHKLTMAAAPCGAVITRIDAAHIEHLGSMENIVKAKLEICDGLPPGAPLVLCGDDEWLQNAAVPSHVKPVYAGLGGNNEVRGENVRRAAHGLLFDIVDKQYGEYEAFVPSVARHDVQNALLAYAAATRLGLNALQAAAALAASTAPGSRHRLGRVRGIQVIEDFYNAGPQSMKAALETLAEVETEGRRIAVLGDMKELGALSEDAHKALAPIAQQNGVDLLVTVGPLAALAAQNAAKRGLATAVCESNEEAATLLRKEAKPGDTVLLKASRGMKFEEILQAFGE
ncbi:UDP-N-acetylmuramoyl-tripeptide--D-alanyl-D-alanine ligase [Ruminococcaceae bacterium OttesenSCG-928-O06]|nr:UDP-N-acetylmuramoyl-tripeptide--D-alanyl-D-alanine ligase [Ruminococcaceae bacterium OttesenSCG-928-O06]